MKDELMKLEKIEADLKEAIARGDLIATEAAMRQRAQLDIPQALMAAAEALHQSRLSDGEAMLRRYLQQFPCDAHAMVMLSEVAAAAGNVREAERLLRLGLENDPLLLRARYMLAILLRSSKRTEESLEEVVRLLECEPENPVYLGMRAQLQVQLGDYEPAIATYEALLAKYSDQPKLWKNLGHVLKTVGRVQQAIDAYRHALRVDKGFGEVWWSLANLKSFHFDDEDIGFMSRRIAAGDGAREDRLLTEFALGKALEDRGRFGESFSHYARGNALQRAMSNYSADNNTRRIRWLKRSQSQEFFEERKGAGCTEPDPIFIIGMTRAGSTLLEQILASHSQVEGTMELPVMVRLAAEINATAGQPRQVPYEQLLPVMKGESLRALGERYLELSRPYRKQDRPFFIDKLPENFLRTGMIHLILPNAKIIDARRHPLACGFSNFKQHFSSGRNQNYALEDIGRYYRDYVELMDHYDSVLPGRVHRVIYERVVDDAEAEVRKLLAYCGLDFEEECVRFFENGRAVRTPSAQQVRRPIYREGVEQWRNYEPWLQPLKDALGDVLQAYPVSPGFPD